MSLDHMQFESVEDVERYAAQMGITFTKSDQSRIYSAEAGTRERLDRLAKLESEREKSDAELALLETPKQIKAIEMRSMRFFAFVQAAFTTYGVGVILALVAVVEVFRVAHGIELFEVSTILAYAGAFTLVLLNLTTEFIITYVEAKTGYEQPTRSDFSFVTVWRRLRYVVGSVPDGERWQAKEKSPAHTYKSFVRLLTVGILFLAVAGSMKGAIEQATGTWYDALWLILTQSSLLDMMVWVSGLVFAIIVVLGAQHLTRYIAHKAGEAVAFTSDVATDSGDVQEASQKAAVNTAVALLVSKQQKNAESSASARAALETANTDDEDTEELVPVNPQ